MSDQSQILLIGGSLRSGSTNAAALATAQQVAPDGVQAVLYDGLARLPHFNPDDDPDGGPVDDAVADLRAQIRAARAILFCTPEYAGSLPGSFKNLLDWTVGGGETYAKPVAWINVSGRAAAGAHDTLRKVLGYTGSDIVESACAQIPVTHDAVGADGLIGDPAIRAQLEGVLSQLAAYAARHDSE